MRRSISTEGHVTLLRQGAPFNTNGRTCYYAATFDTNEQICYYIETRCTSPYAEQNMLLCCDNMRRAVLMDGYVTIMKPDAPEISGKLPCYTDVQKCRLFYSNGRAYYYVATRYMYAVLYQLKVFLVFCDKAQRSYAATRCVV